MIQLLVDTIFIWGQDLTCRFIKNSSFNWRFDIDTCPSSIPWLINMIKVQASVLQCHVERPSRVLEVQKLTCMSPLSGEDVLS